MRVRNHFLSLDPYMRGRMNDTQNPTYRAAAAGPGHGQGGTVWRGGRKPQPELAARRQGGRDARLAGIRGFSDGTGMQKRGRQRSFRFPPISDRRRHARRHRLVWTEPDLRTRKPGETVWRSAPPRGAVGSAVGQLAKRQGCRVIGIAGGAEKCGYRGGRTRLRRLCLDYKTARPDGAALKDAAPDGIDCLFRQCRRRGAERRAGTV